MPLRQQPRRPAQPQRALVAVEAGPVPRPEGPAQVGPAEAGDARQLRRGHVVRQVVVQVLAHPPQRRVHPRRR